MTDKEIIKALEHCQITRLKEDCKGCTYLDCNRGEGCLDGLFEDIINLTHRLQSENTRLKNALDKVSKIKQSEGENNGQNF